MNNQLFHSEKTANFSVGLIPVLLAGAWLIYAALLTQLGYGLDTDAWLMARTADLLRSGDAYDPARSLGNPFWEFLLTFLQPDFEFRISNGLNLLLSLWFLFRLQQKFLADWQKDGKAALLLSFCLMPVFTEAATSSMEYVLAWLLLLESLIALRERKHNHFIVLCLLAGFTRAEFSLYLIITALYFNPQLIFRLLIPGLSIAAYLIWATGKNPVPFSTMEDIPVFFAGRVWFLIRQAGLLLPLYLLLLFLSLRQKDLLLKWPGRFSLFFFIFLPFEWAYAFPAMLSGGLVLAESLRGKAINRWLLLLSAISLSSTILLPYSGLPALYQERQLMLRQYQLASELKPARPLLLTDGATFLPTRSKLWERSHGNRLFHKPGSNLWVSERFTNAELDSLRREGFSIRKFSGKPGETNWLSEVPERQ